MKSQASLDSAKDISFPAGEFVANSPRPLIQSRGSILPYATADYIKHDDQSYVNHDKNVALTGAVELNRDDLTPQTFTKLVELYLTRRVGDEELLFFKETLKNTPSLCNAMGSDALKGLQNVSDVDLKKRGDKWGTNAMKEPAKNSFFSLWFDAFKDPMMIILVIAAIISLTMALAFGKHKEVEWIEGFAIICSVLAVTTVTASNDYSKEKQFRELQGSAKNYCTVVRNGVNVRILTTEVLTGDILTLEAGEELPCDCILTHNLGSGPMELDESSMTGETDPMKKNTAEQCLHELNALGQVTSITEIMSPIIVGGTTVVEGSGYGMALAVGPHSQLGMNQEKLAMDTEPTPLQNKLAAVASVIGKAGGLGALLIFLSLTIQYWIIWGIMPPEERGDGMDAFRAHLGFITEAITIVVVAVPEGLPLAVTISLAYSVKKMLSDQNYVRKLQACEIMGGATDICSDKTGTLTKNKMTVVAWWNASFLVKNFKFPKDSEKVKAALPTGMYRDALFQNILINSTGALDIDAEKDTVKHVGNASECSLIEFAHYLGENRDDVRAACLGEGLTKMVKQVPFSSMRKSMTTVIEHPTEPGMYRVLVKGAAEVIMDQCTTRIDSSSSPVDFPEHHRARTKVSVVSQLAANALRTLCLGFHDFDPKAFTDWDEKDARGVMKCEKRLCNQGVFGIQDPVRDEVPDSILRMQRSGVKVRMVTGDNIDAAKAIGAACHIYRPQMGGIAMLGPEFTAAVGGIICKWCKTPICSCPINKDDAAAREENKEAREAEEGKKKGCCGKKEKDDDELGEDEIPPIHKRVRVDVVGDLEAMRRLEGNLEILARSQPADKYTLVVGLRQLGKIVCVTGDGANDAPALKRADVGMAMGLTGKDAAKEASDVVLLDDNFYGIVRACVWGRNIYENISRFLQFQLTVNCVAVLLSFLTAFLVRSSALSTVQLLWLNMIMDALAALALATDDPDDSLLDRPPVQRDQGLVTKSMWRAIITSSIYQMIVSLFIIFCGECWIPETNWLSKEEVNFIHEGGWTDCPPSDKDCMAKYPKEPHYFPTNQTTCNWIGGEPTVTIGRMYKMFSPTVVYPEDWLYDARIGASRHYTILFNTFVFMQICNLLLSRKLGNDLHILRGIWTNKIWIGVFVGSSIMQVFMVQFGGVALSVHPKGLTWQQWLISIGLGLGMIPYGLLIRLIPQKTTDMLMPPEIGKKEIDPIERQNTFLRLSSSRLSSKMLIHSQNESTTLRRNYTRERLSK